MAKASRLAVQQAQAQRDMTDRVTAIEQLVAKIAEKLGVSLDDAADEGESSKPAETKTTTGRKSASTSAG